MHSFREGCHLSVNQCSIALDVMGKPFGIPQSIHADSSNPETSGPNLRSRHRTVGAAVTPPRTMPARCVLLRPAHGQLRLAIRTYRFRPYTEASQHLCSYRGT